MIQILQGGLVGLSFSVAGIGSAVFRDALNGHSVCHARCGDGFRVDGRRNLLAGNSANLSSGGLGPLCAVIKGAADIVIWSISVGAKTEIPQFVSLILKVGRLILAGASDIARAAVVGGPCIASWRFWAAAVDNSRKAAVPVAAVLEEQNDG